jgi:hypothetical protein
VTSVSRLTRHAISEALSLGQEVVAVSVVIDQGDEGQNVTQTLEQEWAQWDPGVPLRILHTEYSSVVEPVVAFIDEAGVDGDQQIVVLIPVVIPDRFRYRILHNQIDHVLSAALRTRTDVVVARVAMPLQAPPISAASTGEGEGLSVAQGSAKSNDDPVVDDSH